MGTRIYRQAFNLKSVDMINKSRKKHLNSHKMCIKIMKIKKHVPSAPELARIVIPRQINSVTYSVFECVIKQILFACTSKIIKLESCMVYSYSFM